jgi:hypothetical protein
MLTREIQSASEVTLSPVIHLTQEEAASPISVFKMTHHNKIINEKQLKSNKTLGELLKKSPMRGQKKLELEMTFMLNVPPSTQRN